MLNITHYQRNENQNHYEVPFHASQNAKPLWGTISRQSEWLQSKSLQIINAGEGVEKRDPLTMLVGMQTSAATPENSVESPKKNWK